MANLRKAAAVAGERQRALTIEPINTRDVPGYFLNRQDEAHSICTAVGAANLAVQMDLYHCQIVEGDVARKIEKFLPGVSHMQMAGVPDRHEPDEGEVNYPYLFDLIDRLGYAGWIGCEYRRARARRPGSAGRALTSSASACACGASRARPAPRPRSIWQTSAKGVSCSRPGR